MRACHGCFKFTINLCGPCVVFNGTWTIFEAGPDYFFYTNGVVTWSLQIVSGVSFGVGEPVWLLSGTAGAVQVLYYLPISLFDCSKTNFMLELIPIDCPCSSSSSSGSPAPCWMDCDYCPEGTTHQWAFTASGLGAPFDGPQVIPVTEDCQWRSVNGGVEWLLIAGPSWVLTADDGITLFTWTLPNAQWNCKCPNTLLGARGPITLSPLDCIGVCSSSSSSRSPVLIPTTPPCIGPPNPCKDCIPCSPAPPVSFTAVGFLGACVVFNGFKILSPLASLVPYLSCGWECYAANGDGTFTHIFLSVNSVGPGSPPWIWTLVFDLINSRGLTIASANYSLNMGSTVFRCNGTLTLPLGATTCLGAPASITLLFNQMLCSSSVSPSSSSRKSSSSSRPSQPLYPVVPIGQCVTGCQPCPSSMPTQWRFTISGQTGARAAFNGTWIVYWTSGCLWQFVLVRMDGSVLTFNLFETPFATWTLQGIINGTLILEYSMPSSAFNCAGSNTLTTGCEGPIAVSSAQNSNGLTALTANGDGDAGALLVLTTVQSTPFLTGITPGPGWTLFGSISSPSLTFVVNVYWRIASGTPADNVVIPAGPPQQSATGNQIDIVKFLYPNGAPATVANRGTTPAGMASALSSGPLSYAANTALFAGFFAEATLTVPDIVMAPMWEDFASGSWTAPDPTAAKQFGSDCDDMADTATATASINPVIVPLDWAAYLVGVPFTPQSVTITPLDCTSSSSSSSSTPSLASFPSAPSGGVVTSCCGPDDPISLMLFLSVTGSPGCLGTGMFTLAYSPSIGSAGGWQTPIIAGSYWQLECLPGMTGNFDLHLVCSGVTVFAFIGTADSCSPFIFGGTSGAVTVEVTD
jgi:hypothetical protein